MKILVYGINFAPELTGIGKYSAEMAAWLAAAGHEVRVKARRVEGTHRQRDAELPHVVRDEREREAARHALEHVSNVVLARVRAEVRLRRTSRRIRRWHRRRWPAVRLRLGSCSTP